MSVPVPHKASDHYSLLGVSRDATAEEIKRAYRKLAIELHPDRNPSAEERFKEITLAYQILSSPARRKRYDEEQRRMGGRMELWKGPPPRTRGDDLSYRLDVTFEQSITGTTSSVTFPRKATCGECGGSGALLDRAPTRVPPCADCGGSGKSGDGRKTAACERCHGRGLEPIEACTACGGTGRREQSETIEVPVPGGIEGGRRLRLAGWGDDGASGGENGNLFVIVTVGDHPLLSRDKDDVKLELPITFVQALLGDEVSVPTADGPVTLKVPPGSSADTLLKLKGRGVKKSDGSRGDQLVRLQVLFPDSLGKEQRAALEELAKSWPPESDPRIRKFRELAGVAIPKKA
jgi:molecular chaperone DnaJ